MSQTALAVAEEAALVARNDPHAAIAIARRAIGLARAQAEPAAASVAERTWGHALLHDGDIAGALRRLRRAIAHGERAGSAELAAHARVQLAFALAQSGRAPAALRELDAAAPWLAGADAARAIAQRGVVLHIAGRPAEAVAELNTAVPLLRRAGDTLAVQRSLVNRALVHLDLGSLAAATADLRAAEALATELGRPVALGIIAENLGLVDALRGDVPAALAHLDRAEHILATRAAGAHLGAVCRDRAELLLSVGLATEARAAAERAVGILRAQGRRAKEPEARLLVAQAALLDGDVAAARRHAARAVREFTAQGRREWAALARLDVLRATAATRRVRAAEVAPVVAALAAAGWPAVTVEARLLAGGPDDLRAAARARHRGPAALRARGWYAAARAAATPSAAVRAARAGLRVLDSHAAVLGATDVRAHWAASRGDLAALGLRGALASGRPERVWEWAERGRARLVARALPPADPRLAELLAELRSAVAAGSARRQVELERRIRDESRLRPGGGPATGAVADPPPWRAIAAAVGDAVFVELTQLDGVLHAVTVRGGRLRLTTLGPVAAVDELLERVPFALDRLARRPSPGAAALLRTAAGALDDALLRPLRVGDAPLVVSPTGVLHSVPWSVLPSCRGRAVVVTPSAAAWQVAAARPSPVERVAVLSGPGLAHARAEATTVAAVHGATATIDATAAQAMAAFADADLVHLAAHGTLRADNPLFSAVTLADGPLVVHDIEAAARVPATVVLAACDSGRGVVRAGDETMGLAATFLARGASTLVAPVLPVPDARTAPLMHELHRGLARGLAPAPALAAAHTAVDDPSVASFITLGAGL